MAKTIKFTRFDLSTRGGKMLVGILAFILSYAMALRAIDTGSLWQYALTFGLFYFAINRFYRTVRNQ